MAYISPWLTHFAGREQATDTARCDLLINIPRDRWLGKWEQQGNVSIDPGVMMVSGTGSFCGNEFIRFRPVCFCDIPEDVLQRHTSIYGRFGLAFNKSFLVAKGANPVFYIAKGSVVGKQRRQIPSLTLKDVEADPQMAFRKCLAVMHEEPSVVRRCEFFDRLVATLMGVLPPPWSTGTLADAYDPVREVQREVCMDLIRHVFAFTKFFDESLPEEAVDNYYMEREWRVSGFVPFEINDIQRVYVAPGFRDRIEREFPGLGIKEL